MRLKKVGNPYGFKQKSKSKASKQLSSDDSSENEDTETNLWVADLLNKAKNDSFTDVEMVIDGEKKHYSPVLNYFKFKKTHEIKPDVLNVTCRITDCTFKNKTIAFGKTGNLGKHLDTHKQTKEWMTFYRSYLKR